MTFIHELDTPALLLDYEKLKENIAEVASFAREVGVQVRPHIKTHKSIKIAQMQLEAGATGITVAKMEEAEVMAIAGIQDILIAYPISSTYKINKIINLLERGIRVKVAVDQEQQLTYLQQALCHTDHLLEVWIKVDSGLRRCGVQPGKEAVQLAKYIMNLSHIRLGGIFTHAGHSYGAKSKLDIKKIGHDEAKAVVESAEDCEKEGIPIKVRSVGSTPTYQTAGKVKGITEIRPGNAAFIDAIQVGLGVTNIERCALTVLSSVVGVYPDRIVFDAGSKSLCLDKGAHGNETVTGYGVVKDIEGITMERLSEEHGVGTFHQSLLLKLNDKVQIIPNHACTVANMFEEYVIHRNGHVIGKWKVDARGKAR
ncbi:alanine racemase [Bacillus pinisoli]|uniref:alanine racemase n=1 Tax=Bacillus pinisoli TaxID=2901866 RepID=UPI001FF67580|nr:alanine racemase [Bacillus pinisoli]